MQLLRLELKGFKSFADHTIIPFSGGMTGIVGPNGSGKSNIADAIRWVLGESNVRQLRGSKGEDIIFSGTEKRRPMMAAEATLVFDQCEDLSEEQFAEMAITRRIYRNGESEFFVNKKAVRLKDIHHLLADTGLGKDSMAIIGQNRVDAILNSKPEERRLFFEDVAGISGFKLNKEEALRRMAATDRNVERVLDLKATLEEQLIGLEKKAEATKQYMALAKEKRLYDGALGLHQYRTSERIQTRLENEQIQLHQEIDSLEEELANFEKEQSEWAEKRQARRVALEEIEASYREVQRQGERLVGEQNLLDEKLRTALRDKQQKEEQLEELKARLTALKQKAVLLQEILQKDSLDTNFWEKEQDIAKVAWEQAQSEAKTAEQQYQTVWSKNTESQTALQDLNGNLERLVAEKELAKGQREEMEALICTLEAEILEVTKDAKAGSIHKETLQEELNRLEGKVRELENKCAVAKEEVESFRKQEKEQSYALQQKEGRLEALRFLIEEHEGYSDATKAVLQERSFQEEVRGTVGDVITVDTKYVMAIQVALGSAWQQVIMNTAKGASAAIQYLKDRKKGRVTFLPLDRVRGRKLESNVLARKGVLGLAVDIISFDDVYNGIMNQLLGRIVVVDTLATALALQKEYQNSLRMVTLEGDLLSPGGAMTGGTVKGVAGAILGRKQEYENLEVDIRQLRISYEESQTAIGEKERALDTLLIEKDKALEVVALQRQAYMEATLSDAHEQERLQRKERVLAETVSKREQLDLASVEQETLQQHFHKQKEELLSTMASADEINQLWNFMQEKSEEEGGAKERAMKASYEVAHRTEMVENRKSELAQLVSEEKEYLEKQVLLQDQVNLCKKAAEEDLPTLLTNLVDELESQKVVEEDILKRRAEAVAKEEDAATQERRLVLSSTDKRQRQAKISQRQVEVEGRVTKARLDAEQALQTLTALGFTVKEAQELALEGKVADWQAGESRLSVAMEALGTVNPNAIEELEEAEGRKTFLEQQLSDLGKAKEQLLEAIAEMDAAMSERFASVFEVVAERFQGVFASLFGGGTAQLVLTEKDNLLASGIEIYIQPPGKKRQPLTLLSGGERALTVIALLFAFLAYRPAPFCVLDEVDAALDEANVERFSKYLKRLDEKTQFIVVTHRKKTMEATEKLHGITMVERGVSRLLSVTFDTVKSDMAR